MAIGEHVFVVVGVVNKFGLVCKNSDPKKMPCLIFFAPHAIWLSDHFQTQEGNACHGLSFLHGLTGFKSYAVKIETHRIHWPIRGLLVALPPKITFDKHIGTFGS